MMQRFKQIFKKLKTQSWRQIIFIVFAVLLLLVLTWFVISNFIFMTDRLNAALDIEKGTIPVPLRFDKSGFDELHLIK